MPIRTHPVRPTLDPPEETGAGWVGCHITESPRGPANGHRPANAAHHASGKHRTAELLRRLAGVRPQRDETGSAGER
ncbi:hypothetical protein FB565_002911 [Actinoplanes lutulentus]|uniref:Uncharacterized protein n=1 Tax=Actinoplanes lutulentus TaxID=1287878 RepID=A0A327Z1E3_9ACTN|nr:hypothetical protein [Actinoplanes lutulentus]MBB2943198.1 hypothetical protein [Actinoplanes lutulentus]RAK28264.1 hypothetical protein B0I29_12031 [Actinoplanes lutulentus]